MTTPGGWPPPAPFPPRPPQARDQTARTIGIVALVLGGLALLAQAAMVVLPGLLFLPFAFGAGEGWVDEGPLPSTTSAFVGGVTLDSGRAVSGEALAAAVRRHGDRTGALEGSPASLRCDDVGRVTPETSVLCRAADGEEWYAVVRFTDDSGSFVVTVLSDFDDPW